MYHVFSNIISGDDIINGKPDPEPYLKMAELISANPGDCVVFEDSNSGIQSALSAGMKVVTVTNTNLKDPKILFNISDFTELNVANGLIDYIPNSKTI